MTHHGPRPFGRRAGGSSTERIGTGPAARRFAPPVGRGGSLAAVGQASRPPASSDNGTDFGAGIFDEAPIDVRAAVPTTDDAIAPPAPAAVELPAAEKLPPLEELAAAEEKGRRRRRRGGRRRRKSRGDEAPAAAPENRDEAAVVDAERAVDRVEAIIRADESSAPASAQPASSQSPALTADDEEDVVLDLDDDRDFLDDEEEADETDALEPAPSPAAAPGAAERSRRGGRRRGRGRGDEPRAAPAPSSMPSPAAQARDMIINVADPDECRIAILCENRLDELFIERTSSTSHVGNIYKGRVTNVEPSIQAAFIDFGLPSHGFLHVSDLHPNYFPNSKGEPELVGRKTPRRSRPPIQQCLRRGQEIIVQIIKEGIGTKGPTLTTYLSMPGRFLVMMPGMDELGVSRKIEDDEQRRKMRDLLSQLSLPKDIGFIVRTAGIDRTKRDLQRDLNYLTRLWRKVQTRLKKEPAPAELYKESDLVIRTIRDLYDSNLRRIVVDNEAVADRIREFLKIAHPRSADIVEVHTGREPLFHKHGIEAEIDKLHSRQVSLPCGGSLVIESTEALVAIDVNSGRFRIHDNAEETAYRVNIEAVDEIARQLRLRDLGGLIICDFIDMIRESHRRDIEQRIRDALKRHKERAKILRMSKFGIIEMTRQRQRPSFAKSMYRDCPRCAGTGRVKATESVTLDLMRQIRLASQREGVARIDVRVAAPVANDLLNRKRSQITELENAAGQTIYVHAEPDFRADEVEISCTDRRGREAALGGPGVDDRAGAPSGSAGRRDPRGQTQRGQRNPNGPRPGHGRPPPGK